MILSLPLIYPITQPSPSLSVKDQVRSFAEAGAALIQIRDKNATSRELFEIVSDVLSAASENGTLIVVNDRVDIAMLTGAKAVHLGQTDIPPDAARRSLGDDAIIGLSTHNLQQAKEASHQPVDHIAVGPIFRTTTKADPDPIVGIDGLKAIREALPDIPIVAIGGITRKNIGSVFEAGADSAAVIGGLHEGGRLAQNYKELSDLARNVKRW